MKNSLSPRDWQDLSAYLDHQLNPIQSEKLEYRLNAEPELREALQDLSQIQAILRRQTALRAPRNFTLSPQMVGKRSNERAYPALRLAAALASLLFLVLFVGDLLGTGQQAVPPQPAMVMQAELAQPFEMDTAQEDMQAAPPAAKMAPEGSPVPEERAMGAMTAPSEETTSASQESARQAETEAPMAFEAQELSVEGQPDQANLEMAAVEAEEQASRRVFGFELEIQWLRGAEIALALIALLTGLSAIYFRRRA